MKPLEFGPLSTLVSSEHQNANEWISYKKNYTSEIILEYLLSLCWFAAVISSSLMFFKMPRPVSKTDTKEDEMRHRENNQDFNFPLEVKSKRQMIPDKGQDAIHFLVSYINMEWIEPNFIITRVTFHRGMPDHLYIVFSGIHDMKP